MKRVLIQHSSFIFGFTSRCRFPDRIVEVFENLLELAVKQPVETIEAASFGEDEVFLHGDAVHDEVGFGLGSQYFQPVTLRRGPGP